MSIIVSKPLLKSGYRQEWSTNSWACVHWVYKIVQLGPSLVPHLLCKVAIFCQDWWCTHYAWTNCNAVHISCSAVSLHLYNRTRCQPTTILTYLRSYLLYQRNSTEEEIMFWVHPYAINIFIFGIVHKKWTHKQNLFLLCLPVLIDQNCENLSINIYNFPRNLKFILRTLEFSPICNVCYPHNKCPQSQGGMICPKGWRLRSRGRGLRSRWGQGGRRFPEWWSSRSGSSSRRWRARRLPPHPCGWVRWPNGELLGSHSWALSITQAGCRGCTSDKSTLASQLYDWACLSLCLLTLLIFFSRKRIDNPWESREAPTIKHGARFIHFILLISKYLNKLCKHLLFFNYKFWLLGMWIENLKLSRAELAHQVFAWNISVLIIMKNVEMNFQPILVM